MTPKHFFDTAELEKADFIRELQIDIAVLRVEIMMNEFPVGGFNDEAPFSAKNDNDAPEGAQANLLDQS